MAKSIARPCLLLLHAAQQGYVAPQSELEQRSWESGKQVLGGVAGGLPHRLVSTTTSLIWVDIRYCSCRFGASYTSYLGYEVPVVDLFQYPTIHALSAHLSGQLKQQSRLQTITKRVQQEKRSVAAIQKYKREKRAMSREELLTNDEVLPLLGSLVGSLEPGI